MWEQVYEDGNVEEGVPLDEATAGRGRPRAPGRAGALAGGGLRGGGPPRGLERGAGEDGAEPMINIDLDHPAVGATDGAPLFLKHGGNAPFLEHVAGILRRLHDGLGLRKPLFDTLERFDLIEPIDIQGELGPTMNFSIPGFSAVSIDRLNGLGGDALHALNQSGHLYAAYLMVASLNNIGRLIEMKAKKVAAGSNGGPP